MVSLAFQRMLFDATSRLTDRFPVAGAHLLDRTVRPAVGNPLVASILVARNRRTIASVASFRRVVVVPDSHIGDAVLAQGLLAALRDYFPDATVDFLVNKTVAPLIVGHPDATRVIPVFSGGFFPSAADLARVRDIVRSGGYDLCVNQSPFISDADLAAPGQVVLNFATHGPVLVRNEQDPSRVNHFLYQGYWFLRDLLATVAVPVRRTAFSGADLFFSDDAIALATKYANDAGLAAGAFVIQLNPDAATRFTTLPFDVQVDLLRRLASLDATVLVGAGHTTTGVGQRLVDTLPAHLRPRAHVVPASLPLDAYSALMDWCDVFISGDTGPLHLAAARRHARDGTCRFRNLTAVLSVFGATPARMSGYDSAQPGYPPANQDAPSWCYAAGSPCRNITCLNKMFKTCRVARCFDDVDCGLLARLVERYFDDLVARRQRST